MLSSCCSKPVEKVLNVHRCSNCKRYVGKYAEGKMNQPAKPMTADEIVYGLIREYAPENTQGQGHEPVIADRALDELKRTIESVKVEQDPERPGHRFYHDMVVDRVLQALGLQDEK